MIYTYWLFENFISETQNFLSQVIDELPYPVFWSSIYGRILGDNQNYADYFGKDITGKSINKIFLEYFDRDDV